MNVLTPCHLAEHLQWCQMKVLGRRLFFSDKSHDLLSCADGHTHIYRHQGEHYAPNCMHCSDMGWAGIHHGLRMALVHVEGALTRSCSIRSSTVECFSMIMPNHMLDTLVWSFCSATHLDITAACRFTGLKHKNISGMHWISMYTRGIHHP